MGSARWKLVSLWFSQTARVTADNALRFFVCLEYASRGTAQQNSAWYLVNAIFTMPAVFLAPFNGAICNTLPKSRVLRWSALFGVAVMTIFALVEDFWLACWALISIGSSIYGPTRYAMLPAAAHDTKWALSRINGFIEMGTFSAILGGMILILGTGLNEYVILDHWNAAIVVVALLNGLAWLTALPVRFPSDVRRDEPPLRAVVDFFSDFRRIWNIREARICLIGLSGKRGLVIGMSGAMLAILFRGGNYDLKQIAVITCWVAVGVAVGSLAAGLQQHPRRVLGLVPLGGVGFALGMGYAAETFVPMQEAGEAPIYWFCALVGGAAGLINVPLAATFQAAAPDDARGNAMAVRNMTDYVAATVFAIGLYLLSHYADFDGPKQLWLVASIALVGAMAAFWIFRREFAEQFVELAYAIMYRFRVVGPGLENFPLKGPVIVVANHSSWMDPMWLGKVLPRTMIPMMTSLFFDHWLLRWTMVYLADAIRVEASGFRRDVPELRKAIAALDDGKCLVIFPEGRLRRTEEQPLKLFGQGIWHILRERPNTPVVICWIEGGWGSYFSYYKGLPTKNKKFDIARPIGIAVGEAKPLDAETLADNRKTRQYLMEQCIEARKYLGLEPLSLKPAEVEVNEEA
jgi:1-acyl-sn-glycerol-3-phosphate acyltransferase